MGLAALLAPAAQADCARCAHGAYAIEGHFDGVALMRGPAGGPVYGSCPDGWAFQASVSQGLCAPDGGAAVRDHAGLAHRLCDPGGMSHRVWVAEGSLLIGDGLAALRQVDVPGATLRCGTDIHQAPTFTVVRVPGGGGVSVFTATSDGQSFRRQALGSGEVSVGTRGFVAVDGGRATLYAVDPWLELSATPLPLEGGATVARVDHLVADEFAVTLAGAPPQVLRVCKSGAGWLRSEARARAADGAPRPPVCAVPIPAAAARWAAEAPGQPAWSDGSGWNDPSNYETIQAVAVGTDLYLIALADGGIVTLRLDREAGHWDVVTANDPAWRADQGWSAPEHHRTIQAVAVGEDLYLLARAAAGMVTLRLDRAEGRWERAARNDPAWSNGSGWDDPTNYETIQAVAVGPDLYLIARANAGLRTLRLDAAEGLWVRAADADLPFADRAGWADPANQRTIQAVGVAGSLYVLARANAGLRTYRLNPGTRAWERAATNDPGWSDAGGWDHPSHYGTIQAVGAGGTLYVLARGFNGLVILRLNPAAGLWERATEDLLPLSNASGWAQPRFYATIQARAAGDDLYLLARASTGMVTWRLNPKTEAWDRVTVAEPAWSSAGGWDDPGNNATIQAVGVGGELHLLGRANAGMLTLRLVDG